MFTTQLTSCWTCNLTVWSFRGEEEHSFKLQDDHDGYIDDHIFNDDQQSSWIEQGHGISFWTVSTEWWNVSEHLVDYVRSTKPIYYLSLERNFYKILENKTSNKETIFMISSVHLQHILFFTFVVFGFVYLFRKSHYFPNDLYLYKRIK